MKEEQAKKVLTVLLNLGARQIKEIFTSFYAREHLKTKKCNDKIPAKTKEKINESQSVT